MCETYNERGIERIGVFDLGTGGWNFLLVAIGGTLIGELLLVIDSIFVVIFVYLISISTYMRRYNLGIYDGISNTIY